MQGFIEIQLLDPILEYLPRCPVDSKILQRNTEFVACPLCGARICTEPCAEDLAENNRSCPRCKKYKFGPFRPLLSNMKFIRKLESLRTENKISESVYLKLREEYVSKIRDLTATVVPHETSEHD